jgi:hypothetical protein
VGRRPDSHQTETRKAGAHSGDVTLTSHIFKQRVDKVEHRDAIFGRDAANEVAEGELHQLDRVTVQAPRLHEGESTQQACSATRDARSTGENLFREASDFVFRWVGAQAAEVVTERAKQLIVRVHPRRGRPAVKPCVHHRRFQKRRRGPPPTNSDHTRAEIYFCC